MKLVTTFQHPPIPIRDFDWVAYDDSRGYEPGDPVILSFSPNFLASTSPVCLK